MALVYLKANNIRIYEDLEIYPSPRFNVISGDNASGKTSLLEVIHILSTGRSFRTSQMEQVIRRNQVGLGVFGRVLREGAQEISLGIERRADNWRIRIAGEEKRNLSALAERLPVQFIAPDTHFGFQKYRQQRLKTLDWGVFHVEPEYKRLWRDYRHVLEQRNRLLKDTSLNPRTLQAWDEQFVELGSEITKLRQTYIKGLRPYLAGQVAEFGQGLNLQAHLSRGWDPDLGLDQALSQSFNQDRTTGSSQVGPHRADLILENEDQSFEGLSQGQQKLALTRLYFAQIKMLEEEAGLSSVMLMDDLPSELDADNRGKLLAMSASLKAQFFITAISPGELEIPAHEECRRFHVEHGRIQHS